MNDLRFLPFYERVTTRFPVPFLGKLLISVLLGLVFLAAHFVSVRGEILGDWSWFLAVLISTAMLCLYYATHTLQTMFPEMRMRLGAGRDEIYWTPLRRILSDRNFVWAGVFFGFLNCGFGYAFESPYTEGLAFFTIFGGYFLAGFVCGMAVFGIYGVSVAINAFSHEAKPSLDFTSPDHCGGTQFIGDALVVFGSITLIVGVMISVYILRAPWTREMWWVTSLMWCWVVFPYVASLVALIGPAVEMNRVLREYKVEQEVVLKDRLTTLHRRLEDGQLDATERKTLRADYEYQTRMRNDLYSMRTWPYGLRSNLKYITVFVINLFASVDSVREWLTSSLPPSG